jgi:hypothetical protein
MIAMTSKWAISMRLHVSYNLCSKLGSKLIFGRNYGKFSFTKLFSNFDCIFLIVIPLKVGPDEIYAHTIYLKFKNCNSA